MIPFGSVIGNRAAAGRAERDRVEAARLRRKAQVGRHCIRPFRMLFRHEGVFAQRLEATRAAYGEDELIAEVLAVRRCAEAIAG